MDIQGILIFLAVGAIAGFLAAKIVRGSGFGLIGDIVVGVIGAVVGGYLFPMLGIAISGLLGQIVMATAGAIVFIFIIRLIKRA